MSDRCDCECDYCADIECLTDHEPDYEAIMADRAADDWERGEAVRWAGEPYRDF